MTCTKPPSLPTYHSYEWVMSRIGMSHVTPMNESYHTCEWVMSHIWTSHVTHMNESCHTCKWVISRTWRHTWMSHVTHMNVSFHAYEWVTSRIWISHVMHMNEPCHTYVSENIRRTYTWSQWHAKKPLSCLRVTPVNDFCHAHAWHTYESGTSHTQKSAIVVQLLRCNFGKMDQSVLAHNFLFWHSAQLLQGGEDP